MSGGVTKDYKLLQNCCTRQPFLFYLQPFFYPRANGSWKKKLTAVEVETQDLQYSSTPVFSSQHLP
jgi:hypothetical protein